MAPMDFIMPISLVFSITVVNMVFAIPTAPTSRETAAIAVRMILEGEITEPGVHIPVMPGIYNPILEELSGVGINFIEKTTPL